MVEVHNKEIDNDDVMRILFGEFCFIGFYLLYYQ